MKVYMSDGLYYSPWEVNPSAKWLTFEAKPIWYIYITRVNILFKDLISTTKILIRELFMYDWFRLGGEPLA